MAERHSSGNGVYGGPNLPNFYGVIGAAVFGMAALTILMATQMSVGLMNTSDTGEPGRAKAGSTYSVAVLRAS